MEGPTDDVKIVELRERQKRNVLATLLLSQGVPMICGGDEMGRTQQGNNNAYGQDNEISWLDWRLDGRRKALLAFTRFMIRLRRHHPVLRRRLFFYGWEPLPFVLPAHKTGVRWLPMLDTREAVGRLRGAAALKGGQTYDMEARSVAVFRLEGGKGQPLPG